MTSSPTRADEPIRNTASGNAKVDFQVGVMHGDVNYFRVGADATPAEQYAAGRRNLEAGNVREAERLIGAALTSGHTSHEIRFFYALSIVSGRTLSMVMMECRDQLRRTVRLTEGPSDLYAHGLRAIDLLLTAEDASYLQSPQVTESGERALSCFRALTGEVRDLILKHVSCLLSGVLADQVFRLEDANLDHRRLANGRADRAIKFFIADPIMPVLKVASAVQIPVRQRLLLGLGAVLFVCSLAGSMGSVIQFDMVTGLTCSIILGGTCFVWAWGCIASIRWQAWRDYQARRLRNSFVVLADPWSRPGEERRAFVRFSTVIAQMYEQEFDAALETSDRVERDRWMVNTQGLRNTLLSEAVWHYAPTYSAIPEALHGIVQSQAEAAARQWVEGRLGQWSEPPKRGLARAARGLGFVGFVLMASYVVLLTVGTSVSRGLALGVFLMISLLVIRKASGLDPEWRRGLIETWVNDDFDAQRRSEQESVDAWRAYLEDRPDDRQMETWLEYDKRFIRCEILKLFNLRPREVVTEVVLTEAAPGCRKARLKGGPARFSEYVVRTFVLTDTGVRQVTVDLDFLDGSLGNQQRLNFSYQALASASVIQRGKQYRARDRRHPMLGGNRGGRNSGGYITSRLLQLTLVSGTSVEVQLENYQEWSFVDRHEKAEDISAMAIQSSGVASALAILEAIAAEGPAWMVNERRRYADFMSQDSPLERATGRLEGK